MMDEDVSEIWGISALFCVYEQLDFIRNKNIPNDILFYIDWLITSEQYGNENPAHWSLMETLHTDH